MFHSSQTEFKIGEIIKSSEFCYWLQGHFELNDTGSGLTPKQTAVVKRHLSLVFVHELDDAADGGDPAKKEAMQAIHDGVGIGKKLIEAISKAHAEAPIKSNGGGETVYRC